MLALSFRGGASAQPGLMHQVSAVTTVARKPVTGESAKETVKTIAQGRPE
jgi:hypothetical protein